MRRAIHAIQSVALLVVHCNRRYGAARYPPGNRPALPSVGLSVASDYLRCHHTLDDVLSVALEDRRIAGGTRHRTRWSAALLLRTKAAATLGMKVQFNKMAQVSHMFGVHS